MFIVNYIEFAKDLTYDNIEEVAFIMDDLGSMRNYNPETFWKRFPNIDRVILNNFVHDPVSYAYRHAAFCWEFLETLPTHITSLKIDACMSLARPIKDSDRLRKALKRLVNLKTLHIWNNTCNFLRDEELQKPVKLVISNSFLPKDLQDLSIVMRSNYMHVPDEIELDEEAPLTQLRFLVVQSTVINGLDTWLAASSKSLTSVMIKFEGKTASYKKFKEITCFSPNSPITFPNVYELSLNINHVAAYRLGDLRSFPKLKYDDEDDEDFKVMIV